MVKQKHVVPHSNALTRRISNFVGLHIFKSVYTNHENSTKRLYTESNTETSPSKIKCFITVTKFYNDNIYCMSAVIFNSS